MTERIVEVEWEDSASTEEWSDDRQILNLRPGLIRTTGFVHEDSDTMMRLISDMPVDENASTRGRVIAIPRSAIRKIWELRRKR